MKKDYAISSIRMFSTIMVVTLHIFQQLERLNTNIHIATDWFNLGLVMFFCISGFLYSQRTINHCKDWFIHRYKELILPSMITVLSTLIVYSLLFHVPTCDTIVHSILSGLGFEAFVPDGWMFIQCWFLSYIIVCYLSVPVIQRIKVEEMSEFGFWSKLIICTVFLQGLSTLGKIKFGIPTLSWGVMLRFYLTYFLFRRYKNVDKREKVYKVLSVLSVPMLIVTCYIRYAYDLEGVVASIAELLFIYTQTLVGTVLFYYLHELFSNVRISKRVLQVSDKYSYPVFLTHCLFIGYSTSLIFRWNNVAVGIAVSILCTIIASLYVNKINEFVKKILNRGC